MAVQEKDGKYTQELTFQEYFKTAEGKKQYLATEDGKRVEDFINQKYQDAVVRAISYTDNSVECTSPVWGKVVVTQYNVKVRCHREDIVVLSRLKRCDNGAYVYSIEDNKTSKEIDKAGVEKILKQFNEKQRQAIAGLTGVRQL